MENTDSDRLVREMMDIARTNADRHTERMAEAIEQAGTSIAGGLGAVAVMLLVMTLVMLFAACSL